MKTTRLFAVLFTALTTLVAGQQPAASGTVALPEIDAIRAPYLKNVAALRAARDGRASAISRSYVTSLERLRGEVTARGDLDGALTIKAELARAAANGDPSADERKAMAPPLLALRTRFEKDREPIYAATRQQEEQQTRVYLAALEALQRRFTTMNQLEKALTVKAERESYATASVGGEPIAGPAVAPAGATTGSAARLDVPLADKIAEVVRAKSYAKTAGSEPDKPEGGSDVPAEGALLVGFEFLEAKSEGLPDVRSIRPFFLTKEGIVAGKDRGQLDKVTDKVQARNGYAVAGLTVYHNKARIQGLQVTFMKIDARTGRLDPNPAETYRSKWFGTRGRGKAVELGGDGRLVIGVFGRSGADADSIGLVQMP